MELIYSPVVVTKSENNSSYYNSLDITGPGDPKFGKRILCEGDSWMSIGAIPSSNLLTPLKFSQRTLILNLATPGDTMKNMANLERNTDLVNLISNDKFNYQWDAIFMSGGGNDLIDALPDILCTPSEGAGHNFLDYIDRLELAKLRRTLHKNFKTVSQLRDQSTKNKNTPIIIHIYDYPTPRDAPAKVLGINAAGPWLLPELRAHHIPDTYWISITDYIFEELGRILIDLESILPNFHVISNTRGVLTRATSTTNGDWLNEIHPNNDGYAKLSKVISYELHALLN